MENSTQKTVTVLLFRPTDDRYEALLQSILEMDLLPSEVIAAEDCPKNAKEIRENK
jgi:hypothetical protein